MNRAIVAALVASMFALLTPPEALAVTSPTPAAAEPTPSASANPTPAPSPSPSPSASPGIASRVGPSPPPSPSPRPSPTPDPNKPLFDRLQARLGADLARTLAAEVRLSAALDTGRLKEAEITAKVEAEATLIADLEDQVSKLDDDIANTEDQITTQRAQVAGLARAMARRPTSWLVLLARAGNLHEALVEAADLLGAGQHAHTTQTRLQAAVDKLNSDRVARKADLERETAAKVALDASLDQLQNTLSSQEDIAAQLIDLEAQLQDALDGLRDQSPDVAADLAKLLESQLASLGSASRDLAWAQARIGSGRLQIGGLLPASARPANLKLAWPEPGAPISQPFGPTDLVLAPPLGPYPHYHTGIDLAGPDHAPVLAAADGVVVAAAVGKVGYGSYVVLSHGSGVETLYGHLSEIKVAMGDKVVTGQPLGLEGSTGFSTGPHLHFELRLNGRVLDPMPYLPPQTTAKKLP